MLGFQAFSRGVTRSIKHFSTAHIKTTSPLHLTWTYKYDHRHVFRETTTVMARCLPIPASSLALLNMREIL